MVCLGNICRSPIAEGILRDKIEQQNLNWTVDSCGTSAYHIGERPDTRGTATARSYGVDISNQRARQLRQSDLDDFDFIFAMDTSNYHDIMKMAKTDQQRSKVDLLLNQIFPGENRAVPDPYYDGGFDRVFKLLDNACDSLMNQYA
jgi:protein-tyrosine phosphatase